MREYQEKRKLRKIFGSKIALVFLFCLSLFLIYSAFNVYKKSRHAVSKNNAIEKELADLERRKIELESEITRLKSDFGAEEEIRKKFNVVRPGEEVLVIMDKNNENDKIDEGKNTGGFFSGIWQKIKDIF